MQPLCPSRLAKFRTARCYGSRHLLLTSTLEHISRCGAGQAGQTLHYILLSQYYTPSPLLPPSSRFPISYSGYIPE